MREEDVILANKMERRGDYKNIENIIRDTALAVQQSAKVENSGLVSDLKTQILLMKEHHKAVDEKLDLLLTKASATNGSVMSLKLWRSYLTGAVGILTIIVIPMIVYVFNTSLDTVDKNISYVKEDYAKIDTKLTNHLINKNDISNNRAN